jgi:transcriptional antiterminator NusG
MSNINEKNLGPRWYVAHTYTGYENKVKMSIEKIVENRGLGHLIYDVQIPVEISTVTNDKGETKEVETKLLPGYVLVKMILTDESWYVVRNTRGVTGFVGPASKPVPLSEEEVAKLGIGSRSVEVKYAVGDIVSIVGGPLEGFEGRVESIDVPDNKVRVIVSMFGRDTPAELELEQVARKD